METQLTRLGTQNPDRWTVLPFVVWDGILAALVWQLGSANRAGVAGTLVAVALVQAAGVAAAWKGAVPRMAAAMITLLLVVSAVTTAWLALDNTAGLSGAAIWPLFGGVLVGLLLQLHLVRKLAG